MCARQPPERRRVDSRAGAGGGTAGLRLGRVYPHARGALVPDRKPVLRLALRVRTRTAHERPADLPRSWQGVGGLQLDQRDDLPARQPARLRALGSGPPAWRPGTTPTPCRTSSGWRPAWRAPTPGWISRLATPLVSRWAAAVIVRHRHRRSTVTSSIQQDRLHRYLLPRLVLEPPDAAPRRAPLFRRSESLRVG